MQTKYIITIFITVLTLSCDIKQTDKVIPLIKKDFKLYEDDISVINNWINEQKYKSKYNLEIWRDKETVYISQNNGIKWLHIEDEIANYIYVFFLKSSFYPIVVYPETKTIKYISKYRNSEYSNYKLIYTIKSPSTHLKDYKFYETNDIPKEIEGWVYHLEGNWFIQSPFPEK